MRRHVQTSVIARVIYRLICVILIAAGAFGLFLSFGLSEQSYRYGQRDTTTTAKVIKRTSKTDRYGYETCLLTYRFTVDGTEYSTEGTIPNNYSCHVDIDDDIDVRYQANHPTNNAYGDNEQDEAELIVFSVFLTILSIIPLGIGFVGLVAIHKAMKAEDEVIEAAEARARKRAYRRKLKKAEADAANSQE